MRQLGLSTRAYHRVLKLVRTVADLAGNEGIEVQHLAEGEGVERRGGRERRLPIPCLALSSLEQASPLVLVSSARCAPWPGRERTTRRAASRERYRKDPRIRVRHRAGRRHAK